MARLNADKINKELTKKNIKDYQEYAMSFINAYTERAIPGLHVHQHTIDDLIMKVKLCDLALLGLETLKWTEHWALVEKEKELVPTQTEET